MFTPDQLNTLIKELSMKLGGQNSLGSRQGTSTTGTGTGSGSMPQTLGTGCSKVAITPTQALVIAGIIGGVLSVDSVLVDRAQSVQIVLVGSLKRKTELDGMLDKIGSMSFDDVLRGMLDRL